MKIQKCPKCSSDKIYKIPSSDHSFCRGCLSAVLTNTLIETETGDARGFRLLHIASNHIDVMCDNCKTAFGLQVKDYIICPTCGKI